MSGLLHSTRVRIAAGLLLVLVVAAFALLRARQERRVDIERGIVTASHQVQLDSRIYVPLGVDAEHPAPAVLLAHGLGADLRDSDRMARMLARAGYVVQTWTSRGGRFSDGEVGIAGPDAEVADVTSLIDAMSQRQDVMQDSPGDPRLAVLGISHGGDVALLAGERNRRIDALVPIFAWGSLQDALEPAPGLLKLGWGSQLFAAGSGARGKRVSECGRLERDVCDAWSRAVAAGGFDVRDGSLLAQRSPAVEADRITAPTLLIQGQMDSLFGIEQVLPIARTLRSEGVPVRLEWVRAGHDLAPSRETQDHIDTAIRRWLDRYLRKQQTVATGPKFNVQLGAGRGYAGGPELPPKTRDRSIRLRPANTNADGFIRFVTPPGGVPAESTTLPGLGDVTRLASSIAPPAIQRARFRTAELRDGLEIVGAPTVTLQLRGSAPRAQLFVRIVDLGPRGQELIPRGLVAPISVTDVPPLRASTARTIRVTFPWIAFRVAPGHRLAVEVASSDSAYAAPRPAPARWDIALAGDDALHVPLVDAPTRSPETFEAGASPRSLAIGAAVLALAALLSALIVARIVVARVGRVQEPSLRGVPLAASGLVKRYGRREVVQGVDLRLPPGSVVGLVGPNGAGKTTILRMLLGLVHPDDGAAWLFGQRVRPGAPHLARVGALVEGPGLVPHLTFRAHLVHHARSTDRDNSGVAVDAALAAVDLGDRADQLVRTASQGMRQRLGIAQALLGDPELVILDEPTNGLDPAQIHHLRDIIRDIARDGRTVLVSSHLLHELELVCTHVTLLAEGAVLASGPLSDVVGEHRDLETAFLAAVGGEVVADA